MDLNVIIVLTMFIGMYGRSDAALGTGIPTLFPPSTSAPTVPSKATNPSTQSTTQTHSSTTKGTLQTLCYQGTCIADQCHKNKSAITTVSCPVTVRSCVTEILSQKNGLKQYTFRCATKTCALEKSSSVNNTTILCCSQSKCNTYDDSGASSLVKMNHLVLGFFVCLLVLII